MSKLVRRYLLQSSTCSVMLFLIGCAWVWGHFLSLFHYIPSYGDTLEITWGMQWFGGAVETISDFSLNYPFIVAPKGLTTVTFALGLSHFQSSFFMKEYRTIDYISCHPYNND